MGHEAVTGGDATIQQVGRMHRVGPARAGIAARTLTPETTMNAHRAVCSFLFLAASALGAVAETSPKSWQPPPA